MDNSETKIIEYFNVTVSSNVDASTPYDFRVYTYKIDIKDQIVETEAETNDFKKVEFKVLDNNYRIIVGNKNYDFKREIHIPAIDNWVMGLDAKLNKNICYINYEVLSFQKKKRKIKAK